MPDKDVVVSVQKIVPGKTEMIREHFAIEDDERNSLRDQLREEGVHIESVFIHEEDDGDYLYSYIKAEDWRQMVNDWRESEAEDAVAFKEFLDETIVGGSNEFHQEYMENIFHIEVPQQEGRCQS